MSAAGPPDRDLAIAAVRREFLDGLPARVHALRQALGALPGGRPDALDALLLHAHALTGTAASFGAKAVAGWAAALERRARAWAQQGIRPEELPLAADELVRLADAVSAYRAAPRPDESA